MTDEELIKKAEEIMSRPILWSGTYILDGHTPVPCYNLGQWARWFKNADRHVGHTQTTNGEVSTVFLGIDHSFGGVIPILFETMVFGGLFDGDQERYSTWEEAEEGHKRKVKYVTELK